MPVFINETGMSADTENNDLPLGAIAPITDDVRSVGQRISASN